MKTNWFILLIAALLVLSACDQAATTDVDAGAAADADGDAAIDVTADVGENVKLTPDAKAYMALLATKADLEWKVDYDLSTKAGGQMMDSQMSMYMKGTDKIRTDMSAGGYDIQSYVLDGDVISCTKMGSSWSCTKFTSKDDEQPQATDIEADIQEDASQYTIDADGTMSIAGTTAKCFRITSNDPAQDVTMRQCFSSDAAPLYILMESSAEGQEFRSEMKATAYSKSVASSAFVPPAEPKEFDANAYGGIGAGVGAAGTVEAGSGDNCAACDGLSGDALDICLSYC